MTDRRVPDHLLILVGLSAGAYAVSLAGATALQSATDARVHAAAEPYRVATELAATTHDALDAAVADASGRYASLAERYRLAGLSVIGMEDALDRLADRAAGVAGSTASLPTRVSMPAVGGAPRAVSPPKVQATTGASG